MVFQDPYTSLNPRMTVGDIIGEPFEIHPEVAPKGDRRRKVQELLDVVGPQPRAHQPLPAPVLRRPAPAHRHRPRRWRCNPEVIICDEPVSALDVSVQAQVINLLERLQDEFGLSYIFIAHDLSVVRHISDRVARDVPRQDRRDRHRRRRSTTSPTHPYTQALLSAVPVPDPTAARRARADHPARATCPRRPTRRRAAGSAPAAGRRRTSAPSRSRCCRSAPRHRAPERLPLRGDPRRGARVGTPGCRGLRA